MTVLELLKAGREKIVKGWTKYAFKKYGRKRYCAVGAVRSLTDDLHLWVAARRELDYTLSAELDYEDGVYTYNDNSPSKKRVVELYDKTIARLEKEQQEVAA